MNEQEIIQFLMRQNEMLLGIIAGVYGQREPIVPTNERQQEELAALFPPRDSADSGGEL